MEEKHHKLKLGNQIDFHSINNSISKISNLDSFGNLKKVIHNHDFAAFFTHEKGPDLFQHHHHHPKFESAATLKKEEEAEKKEELVSENKLEGDGEKLKQSKSTLLSELVEQHQQSFSNLAKQIPSDPVQNNEKIKSLNNNIQNIIIYFLSELMVLQPLKTIRATMKVLKETFKIPEEDYKSMERKAYQLTKYYLVELHERKEKLEHLKYTPEFGYKDQATFDQWRKSHLDSLNEQILAAEKLPTFLENVLLTVRNAKNLAIKDFETHSSDPFVSLAFTSSTQEKPYKAKHLFKTNTVKKNINPEWNESFVMTSDKLVDNAIVLTVLDEDLITKNDLIGYTLIHLDDHKQTFPFEEVVLTHKLMVKEKKKSFFENLIHHDKHDSHHSATDQVEPSEIRIQFYPLIREILKTSQKCNDESTNQLINSSPKDNIKSIIDFFFTEDIMVDFETIPAEITQLIELYEKRVGFSSIFRISYHLEKLMEHFTLNDLKWFDAIKSLLVQLSQLLSKDILTKTEEKEVNRVKKIVRSNMKRLIEKYPLSFPVELDETGHKVSGISELSRKSLKSTIEIVILSYDHTNSNLVLKLGNSIKKVFGSFFEIIKAKSQLSIENTQDFDNIVSLLGVYDSIELQLNSDIDIYSTLFPNNLNLSDKSVREYYKFLKEDTLTQLSKETQVCMEVFTLLKKIQELHTGILGDYVESELKGEIIDCDQVFSKFISFWIDESKHQFLTWIQRSLKNEDWKPLDPTNQILHSASVHDLFSIFEIGKNHLFSLNLNLDKHILDFIQIIDVVYMDYIDHIMTSVLSDLSQLDSIDNQNLQDKSSKVNYFNNFIKKIKDQEEGEDSTVSISNNNNLRDSICYKLNNIDYSRGLLDEFANSIEEKIKSQNGLTKVDTTDSFQEIFVKSKTKYDFIVEIVIGRITKWIKISLNHMFSKEMAEHLKLIKDYHTPIPFNQEKVTEFLDSLFTFLNNELQILSNSLYSITFSKFLRGIWLSIWKEIERTLFPDSLKKELIYEEVIYKSSLTLAIYPSLESFFNADGKGISLDQLRSTSEYLFHKIYLYFTPTTDLVSMFNSKEYSALFKPASTELPTANSKSTPSTFIKDNHMLLALAMRSKHGDSAAKQLVSTIKGNWKLNYIQDKFNLEVKEDQVLLEQFKCKSSYGIPTKAYILKYNVCWSSFTSYNENNTSIHYNEVSMISRDSYNDSNSIHLLTTKNQVFDFWSFKPLQREKAFKLISNQTHCFNERVPLVNDEKQHSTPTTTTPTTSNSTAPAVNHTTDEIKTNFNLSNDDKVITTYSVMKHGIIGKLIITENSLCYHNQITSSNQKYLWSDISAIKKETSIGFIPLGVKLLFKSGKEKLYTGFFDKDHLFNDLYNARNHYLEKLKNSK